MRRLLLLVGALLTSLWLGLTVAAGHSDASPWSSAGRVNPAVIGLGYRLFVDPRLSADGTIACSSCHQPDHAFSDGRRVSVGVARQKGTRNTPSLLEVFSGEPLFWDGRRDRLSVAVLDALVNHVEMGNPDLLAVVRRLQASPDYRRAFAKAFHHGTNSPTAGNLGAALAAYVRSLPRPPNAYDRFMAGQYQVFSPQAREGLRLFAGKAACARCHDPANGRFTDGKFHHSGIGLSNAQAHLGALAEAAMRRDLTGAALGSTIGGDSQMAALGRFLVSHRAIDVGAFRTPSLRNVALTAPYMHDGSVVTLPAAVDAEIYYRGLATGRPLALTADERKALLAFLQSLTSKPPVSHRKQHRRIVSKGPLATQS